MRDQLKRLRDLLVLTRFGVLLGVFDQAQLLAVAYGRTDKAHHGYMPAYRRHLGGRRFRRNVLLEIGVGGEDYAAASPGGSLRIWRDYLLRSRILGMDVVDKDVRYGSRVTFVRGDQSSAPDLLALVAEHGVPDIVIDDGSHVGEHQWATFETLWPLLPPGAVYVIEDLSTSFYPGYGGDLPPGPRTGLGLLRQLQQDAQADDVTFTRYPEWGAGPQAVFRGVASVHVYPGIAFIEKA